MRHYQYFLITSISKTLYILKCCQISTDLSLFEYSNLPNKHVGPNNFPKLNKHVGLTNCVGSRNNFWMNLGSFSRLIYQL